MIDLSINHLKKEYFAGPIFSDVTMEVKEGERIGLLGDNGTGKSTVFRIITGDETHNGGEIFMRNGLKVGILQQEVDAHYGKTVKEVMRLAFKDLDNMSLEMKKLEEKMTQETSNIEAVIKQFGELQELFELKGGYIIDDRMKRICLGIKIDDAMLEKSFEILSGGEKSRVMLAKLLLENPDLMLLDEPTNHLDLGMIEWLEQYMNDYKGSVLIISHDRYFLDKVINKVYEIKNGETRVYHGNFSYYLEERQRRYEIEKKQYDQQQKKIKQLETAAKRMRIWANQADNEAMYVRAKAIERRIEKMDKIGRPLKDTNNVSIDFTSESEAGKIILEGKDYSLSIGSRQLLESSSFVVYNGETVGIIGPNGCGKSTMMKDFLSRANDEYSKELRINPRAKIGYLQQDISFDLADQTMIDVFKHYHPDTDASIRNYLARFNFKGEEVFVHVDKLSGGEKVRLMLAILLKQDINVLFLDEPSNHIDIKTREVLENALLDFNGTIVFISHDRFLLDNIASKIIAFEDCQLESYHGNYRVVKEEREKKKEPKVVSKSNPKKKEEKVKEKKINKFKVAECEEKLAVKENELAALKDELASLTTEYQRIQELTELIKQIEVELETLMEEYFRLTDV